MSDLPNDGGNEPLANDDTTQVIDDINEPEPLDEPLDEGGEDGEVVDPAEPQPQAPRRNRPGEVQRLRRELEEARQTAAELRGYRQATEQQRQQQPVDPYAQQRQQQAMFERWDQMAPADAMREMWQLGQQQINQSQMLARFEAKEDLDRQNYEDQVARGSGAHKKYQAEVERTLQAERQRGNYVVTRRNILEQVVGRDAINRGSQDAPRQRRVAQARVEGQRTRPAGAGSDSGSGPRQGNPDDMEEMRRVLREGFARGERL